MSTPFQASVLRTHLNAIDGHACKEAYERHQAHFGNRVMQDTILGMKEEEYQYGFLEDLFVKVLGYTLKPQPDYNLEAEKKNPANSKKADGAILNDLGDVHCVIELKGTDTIDLNRVEAQGFGYLNANPGCRYLVTSNFARLRFYLGDTTAYLEWDLFNLSYDDFRSLWLCLERQSLLADRPMKVREESSVKEEEITKELYRDYSAFKRELFAHLRQNHPDVSPLRLFQLTQKLLDRLLFVFFGEDKGLLPPNTASKPIGDFDKLREIDAGQPLYQLLIKYFNYIDTGTKRKDFEIPAYNGGLFAPDPELDALKIPDPILRKHLLKLTAYQFDSEVDVNILGHIFEHSLNEIEEVQAELRGEAVDKSKTKRKKDGVFYTPRYITKYIVENTVGRLCTEKRNELGIDEQDYARGRKGRRKTTVDALRQNLEAYRAWLLDLKICDPACGSGAFLNEALNFLIAEHENVSELERQLFDSALRFDPGPSILENNLYGVDINDEAVEIARLSLWLRTAQKGRKLTDLSGRIKVGNSLIDDPAVAGDKAFVWVEEFPEVFGEGTRGGFDVVVGNPPYVRVQSLKEHSLEQSFYLERNYQSASGKYDLYVLFIEKSNYLIRDSGLTSFIVPHKFLVSDFGSGVRSFLATNRLVFELLHFESHIVFEEASTYTCIISLTSDAKSFLYSRIEPEKINSPIIKTDVDYDSLSESPWILKSKKSLEVLSRIESNTSLKDMCIGIFQGLISTGDDIFMLEGVEKGDIFVGFSKELGRYVDIENGILKPVLKGKDIKRYLPLRTEKRVIYPHELDGHGNTVPIEELDFKTNFPLAYSYLKNFEEELRVKKIRYKTNEKYWYSLHRSREISVFEKDYIITPQLQNHPSFTIKETDVYADAGGYLITLKEEYNTLSILAVLNSRILWFYISNTGAEYRGGYFYFKTKYLEPFGIPDAILNDSLLSKLATKQITVTKNLETISVAFLRLLQRNFPALEKLSKKLQDWPSLDYAGFVKELNKALKKVKQPKLSLTQEMEWESVFEAKRAEVLALRAEITQLDREIDVAVYRLYGLTWEEVLVVDSTTQEWMTKGEYEN